MREGQGGAIEDLSGTVSVALGKNAFFVWDQITPRLLVAKDAAIQKVLA